MRKILGFLSALLAVFIVVGAFGFFAGELLANGVVATNNGWQRYRPDKADVTIHTSVWYPDSTVSVGLLQLNRGRGTPNSLETIMLVGNTAVADAGAVKTAAGNMEYTYAVISEYNATTGQWSCYRDDIDGQTFCNGCWHLLEIEYIREIRWLPSWLGD